MFLHQKKVQEGNTESRDNLKKWLSQKEGILEFGGNAGSGNVSVALKLDAVFMLIPPVVNLGKFERLALFPAHKRFHV